MGHNFLWGSIWQDHPVPKSWGCVEVTWGEEVCVLVESGMDWTVGSIRVLVVVELKPVHA